MLSARSHAALQCVFHLFSEWHILFPFRRFIVLYFPLLVWKPPVYSTLIDVLHWAQSHPVMAASTGEHIYEAGDSHYEVGLHSSDLSWENLGLLLCSYVSVIDVSVSLEYCNPHNSWGRGCLPTSYCTFSIRRNASLIWKTQGHGLLIFLFSSKIATTIVHSMTNFEYKFDCTAIQ